MSRISAGLLMYRFREEELQVLLAHPGGPFFANKDEGSWTIPKGEIEPGEELLEAAKREFQEETGVIATGRFIALSPIQQKGGKIVHAWAFEGDCDPRAVVSNTFTMELPPKSGRQMAFPEMDRADFFGDCRESEDQGSPTSADRRTGGNRGRREMKVEVVLVQQSLHANLSSATFSKPVIEVAN